MRKAKILPYLTVFWYADEVAKKRIKGKMVLAFSMGLRPDYDMVLTIDPFDAPKIDNLIKLREKMNELPEIDDKTVEIMEQTAYWNPLEDLELALDRFIDIHYSLTKVSATEKEEIDQLTEWKRIIDDLQKDSPWKILE
jgi:hypothetical protein